MSASANAGSDVRYSFEATKPCDLLCSGQVGTDNYKMENASQTFALPQTATVCEHL